jgi:glycosyltransferase involved in cell wall biosynthesis
MFVKPIISAVILARNEEHNIRYCLETVRWCDEIIVVDMESEDRTVTIAREYTEHIYSHAKVEAFDIAKKYGVEQASGDWVLLIDADEMAPKTLCMALKAIAAKDEADIVDIPFRHYIMGDCVRYSGWGYSPLPRFFRRGKITFTKTIHGYMQKASDAHVVGIESLEENCIIHFNYIDSVHFVEKLNRYTSVEAQLLFDSGVSFSYYLLFKTLLREFYGRFFRGKGYRDGVRGFSLCLMMVFYRALSYIKLWEKHQFKDDPVSARYERIKQDILAGWER